MKSGGISSMGSACHAERRAFLKALTTTTAALAMGACGGASDSTSAAASANAPPGGNVPAPNLPPVWVAVPIITFTQGVASSVSIAAYATDPNGDALTITKNAAA